MGLSATCIFRPRSDLGRFVSAVVSPAVQASVEAGAQLMVSNAKAFCPVRTGFLQSRITYVLLVGDKTIWANVFVDGVPYAEFVEFGTGQRGAASAGAGEGPYDPNWPGMPAQPYMRPAVDESKDAIVELFRANIGVAFGG